MKVKACVRLHSNVPVWHLRLAESSRLSFPVLMMMKDDDDAGDDDDDHHDYRDCDCE